MLTLEDRQELNLATKMGKLSEILKPSPEDFLIFYLVVSQFQQD